MPLVRFVAMQFEGVTIGAAAAVDVATRPLSACEIEEWFEQFETDLEGEPEFEQISHELLPELDAAILEWVFVHR